MREERGNVGMKNEEMIVRYLDRQMSVDEEQNFLISLAASDVLRNAFRSHLELNNLVQLDKDEINSAAGVRTRTFAALGLSTAAMDHYLEPRHINPPPSSPTISAPAGSGTMGKGLFSMLKVHALTLIAGIGLGLIGGVGYYQLTDTPSVPPSSVSPTEKQILPGNSSANDVISEPASAVAETEKNIKSEQSGAARQNVQQIESVNSASAAETKSAEATLSERNSVDSTNINSPKWPKGGVRVNPTISAP